MKNKMVFGILAIALLAVAGFAGLTYAYKGNANAQQTNYNADVHAQLEEAMESGDYQAWLEIRTENNLPTRGRIFQILNEDNFDRYVAMHNAMESGDYESADAIRAELGLGQGMHQSQSGSGNVARGGCANQGTATCGNCQYN